MSNCDCHQIAATTPEKKSLIIALILNAMMFIIGLIAGILAQSTSLIADGLDMLGDALAYSLGLFSMGRKIQFKVISAKLSGGLLLILGIAVLVEVIRRAWFGSSPISSVMIIVACISLTVNLIVLLCLLNRFRNGEVHLRASLFPNPIYFCCRAIFKILNGFRLRKYMSSYLKCYSQ